MRNLHRFGAFRIGAAPQPLGKLRRAHRQLETQARILEPVPPNPVRNPAADLFDRPVIRAAIAHIHRRDRFIFRAVRIQLDIVQRGDRLPRAHLARIHRVVAELLLGELTVFIADLAIAHHARRIKFNLDFYIAGNHMQRGRKLIDQQVPGLVERVDIGIHAIALVGQLLQHIVIVGSGTESEHGEIDPLLPLFRHLLQNRLRIQLAQIGHAVRQNHDAVRVARFKPALGQPIAQLQPLVELGWPTRLKPVDRGEQCRLLARRSVFLNQPRLAAKLDNRHLVGRVQLIDQQRQRLLHQAEPFRGRHRTRGIDHQRQHRTAMVVAPDAPPLDAHLENVHAHPEW